MRFYNNKHAETYKKQAQLAFVSFLLNAPNVILCVISAFNSSTLVVWADVVASVGETVHCWIIFVISSKMVKETGDKYNFGMGRLEVFTSFICDVLIIVGLFGVVAGSIYSIFNPQTPTDALLLFCILKAFNVSFDILLFARQLKLNKGHTSKINETETKAYIVAIANDAGVGILSVICYIFRSADWITIVNPIISIVVVGVFLVSYLIHVKDSVYELSDVSIPISEQDKIYDIVMTNKQKFIKRIQSVNCRKLNGKVYIEVSIQFNENVTYPQQLNYLEELTSEINAVQPDTNVKLVMENPDEA